MRGMAVGYAAVFFHYRQEPDPTPTEELIAHKVHGPPCWRVS